VITDGNGGNGASLPRFGSWSFGNLLVAGSMLVAATAAVYAIRDGDMRELNSAQQNIAAQQARIEQLRADYTTMRSEDQAFMVEMRSQMTKISADIADLRVAILQQARGVGRR
jgi:hypothetical protein